MADGQRNFLSRYDVKFSNALALCSDPSVVNGRGKQLWRGIARGTQPAVLSIWLIIWMLSTKDVSLHERLFNMFVGCLVGRLVCNILKMIVKRPRPLLQGGNLGKGLDQYSFPSDHVMVFMIAYYMVTAAYSGNSQVAMVMKLVVLILCIAKVMLGRVYILDVLGGIVLGMIIYQLMVKCLWVSPTKCDQYIKSVQAALHLYR